MNYGGGKSDASNRWKWFILISCLGTKFLNIGLRKSFGVLLTTLHSQLDIPIWILGLVVSISVSGGDIIGPVVGGFATLCGCRPVVIIGGILLSVGMILASFSRSFLQLVIFLCGFCGLGFGLTNDPPFAVLGQYFHEHFSLANSFAMAGSSLGIMLLGPLTQIFVEIYGWRGAMWLLGALVFHITVFGALLRPPTRTDNLDHFLLQEDEIEGTNIEDGNSDNSCSDCCSSLVRTMDSSLFKDPMFIIIILVSTTIRFSQMAWLIYLVPNVVSKGVPILQASFISTSAGVGDLIGRLLPGVFSSVSGREISSKTVWTFGMCITAVSFALDAMVEPYSGMMVLGFFQGLGIGFIYRTTHSYRWSYVVLGVIQALGILILNIGQVCFPSKTTT
ncbi:monocarboxylate transporter 12-like isoform X2 [Amphiura filiformis]|uniref:monocarboxylate transporter 12-like isoform X2 n=1 Tax=Amphiura filiformis TaxID=82378 RepID=UPI003B21FD83